MKFKRLMCIDQLDFTDAEKERLARVATEFVDAERDVSDDQEIIKRAQGADALLISWRTALSAPIIEQLPELRYVGMFCGTYADPSRCNVDLVSCDRRNVVVSTLGQYGDEATAEWVMSRMLLAARSTEPKWRGGVTELYGKQLGIIGLGHVGTHVAHRATAFGMNVVYTGPAVKPFAEAIGWRWCNLDDLLDESDVVTVHVPTGVVGIGASEIKHMRSDALLISSSMGPSIDLDGLRPWLDGGKSAFVCDASVPVEQQELANAHPNAIFDPVVAGMSREMQRRGIAQLIDAAEAFLAGSPIRRHPLP